MLKSFARMALSCAALVLGGCISVGDIDRRAITVNLQVGDTQNQGVLLNLARASRAEPIYFLAMNQLGASGTTDLRVGTPQFFLGPSLPAVDKIATFTGAGTFIDNSTNSNFQMSLLNSKDFYAGLMSPLGLQDVDLLLHQGYSRELIFYLVIDRATITPVDANGKATGAPTVIYNDPTDTKTFATFEFYIGQAMMHGLTTDTYMAPDEAAGDDSDSSDSGDATPAPSAGKGGAKGGGGGAAPAAAAKKKPKLTLHAELCYDRALAVAADIKDIAPDTFCDARPAIRTATDEGAALPVKLNGQSLQVDVTTRSIYGVFYYLGSLMAHEQMTRVHLRHYDLPSENTVDAPLLNVLTTGKPSGGCFAAVGYGGANYCVPNDNADNTKRIFGILNALLALKQSIADQPITQTVRIQQ
jgi:hypothetical protein